jgi:hypothetical protein
VESLLVAAAESPPAGGAAIGQVIIATAAANLLAGGLAWVGMRYRAGKPTPLAPLAKFSERVSGLPAWAAIPSAVSGISLLIALFGMLWDISLHIADGRDEGPLANPAHYFILAGLFGVLAAGFLSMVLPRGKPSDSAIRIRGDWYAPLGGVMITACGAFALIGFPLDDVWHRLFGQDVTLWGPTHLMLIGGAAMTLVGQAVLLVEARRAQAKSGSTRREPTWIVSLRQVALTGAFLLGLSTFQAEFDFGVPQFRFVFEPMMVMLAAGAALVAARIWLGRGAAIAAALFFVVLRGLIAVIVGPVLGEPTPYFPLYLVEAGLVELVALRISTRERPLAFGAAAGALIGTVGLAAEWGWSHVFMPLPWPSALLPEAALAGFAVAIAGALIGTWIGTRLSADELGGARAPSLRVAAVASAAVLAAVTGWALLKPADEGVRGTVVLEEAGGGSAQREVNATVTIDPPSAADDSEWLTVTAWQGGGLVVDRLERVGSGVYRTTEPIPVHGTWKALVRLHHGPSLTGIPIFLPDDPAIPAKGVPAEPRFTREFVADHEILQREQKGGSTGLVLLAYGSVMLLALGFLALLAWGVHRLAATAGGGSEPPPQVPPKARPKVKPTPVAG